MAGSEATTAEDPATTAEEPETTQDLVKMVAISKGHRAGSSRTPSSFKIAVDSTT